MRAWGRTSEPRAPGVRPEYVAERFGAWMQSRPVLGAPSIGRLALLLEMVPTGTLESLERLALVALAVVILLTG